MDRLLTEIQVLWANTMERLTINDIIDILIVAFMIYNLLQLTRETRANQVLKGVGIIIVAYFLSGVLRLQAFNWLLRYIMDAGLSKFARFAQNVWGIDAAGKADEQLAAAGLDAMEAWMREIGCVMNLAELGCVESMLEQLANATFVMEGGYRKLTREEIIAIFHESL